MSNPKLSPKIIKVAKDCFSGALKLVDDNLSSMFSYASFAGRAGNDYAPMYSVMGAIDYLDRAFGVTRIVAPEIRQEFNKDSVESYLRKNLTYGRIQVYTEFDETDPILIEYALLKITGHQIVAVAY